ncbi:hypothetical protein ACYOEI_21880 [Singulisphaera rosea]
MRSYLRATGGGSWSWFCVPALVAATGCEGGMPSVSSSFDQATVHGTVTVKGKRVSSGKVVFDPSNVYRKQTTSASAEIGKDGTYTISTLVGENRINVVSPETTKERRLQFLSLDYEVQGGDNTFDIELPPPRR